MFTCLVRYKVAPGKLPELKEYARAWIRLIEDYGGTHHGYFIPGEATDEFPDARFSFPGLGQEGSPDTAVALFTFPSVEAYERYRRDVSEDERCKAATRRFNESPCFLSYERNFLKPIFEGNPRK
jgi:hypothetical protein